MFLSDDYLVGFTEGEGMFYIGIVPSKETKTNWQVIYFFKVSQNPIGKDVLNQFKDRLKCGYIKQNSQTDLTDKSLAYVVRDFPSLRDKVIPFFEGKLVIKKDAFEKFKQVLKLVEEKQHFTVLGITKILEIAYSMNTQKRRVKKQVILESYMKLESSQAIR
ncbi:hypothetical protein A3D02_03700 [Candidatus Daviesbacteria bacterium RIFCSPHIGHO2_02_FULL_39_41]|nr:MAG: hypothetical protein A3D02_03700 [Candidatus Daviesbacteria bacterium RIFCSPHIGHO2_02_FULL_39_41]